MQKKTFLLSLAMLGSLGYSQADTLKWYNGQQAVSYALPAKAPSVVNIAADMFASDMEAVTGQKAKQMSQKEATIQVQINPKKIKNADGFNIYVKNRKIVVEGNNGRGAAYGLLELSRMAGVSPWIWWGDVTPKKRNQLTIDTNFQTSQKPSVAHRGIFLNDEDWSIRPWAGKNFEPNNKGMIGPKTYKKMFQLLLRLRANAIWPGMHTGTRAFFQTPGAKEIADSCGIIIGTSHCEPLLRNNVDEWNVKERGAYNYVSNKEQVQKYWIERLQEVGKGYEAMYTIGMRGIHDGSMEGVKTMEEKTVWLQKAIDDQRDLLRRYINKDIEKVTQVFVPYKEVLYIYENGLRVPEDVTLMWCDDNYGYMTRLPDAEEQKRKGGGGVYYHLSYWGRPHDFLWLTTTQPGLLYYEMKQAYDHNVRNIWIVNVHDPKIASYDLELFLDMAWDINSVSPSTLTKHYGNWLCQQFGEEAGNELLPVMEEFYRLCAIRRPEFMGWTQVELDKKKYKRGLSTVTSVEMNKQEAEEYILAYDKLCRQIATIARNVRPELQDAYFAAIQYPVYGAAAMARKILSDKYTSHAAHEEILHLTDAYNKMGNGKWDGIMTYNPRNLPVFENINAQLATDDSTVKPLFACNACDYTSATAGAEKVQMLGHSNNAVSLPKGGKLSYEFNVPEKGKYTLRFAVIPTQANDKGDIRFALNVDGKQRKEYSLKEKFRSEQWKQNVLRGQAVRTLECELEAGKHTMEIEALDHHIVADQWMLDPVGDRNFYIFPVN